MKRRSLKSSHAEIYDRFVRRVFTCKDIADYLGVSIGRARVIIKSLEGTTQHGFKVSIIQRIDYNTPKYTYEIATE